MGTEGEPSHMRAVGGQQEAGEAERAPHSPRSSVREESAEWRTRRSCTRSGIGQTATLLPLGFGAHRCVGQIAVLGVGCCELLRLDQNDSMMAVSMTWPFKKQTPQEVEPLGP